MSRVRHNVWLVRSTDVTTARYSGLREVGLPPAWFPNSRPILQSGDGTRWRIFEPRTANPPWAIDYIVPFYYLYDFAAALDTEGHNWTAEARTVLQRCRREITGTNVRVISQLAKGLSPLTVRQ